VRLWVALDVHKLSIVAASLLPEGGEPEVQQIETTERAVRRFIDRLGGRDGLAVCYEAGPGGFDLYRLLTSMGVACDVVAPSLIPVRAGTATCVRQCDSVERNHQPSASCASGDGLPHSAGLSPHQLGFNVSETPNAVVPSRR
jgi:hypothetical protein